MKTSRFKHIENGIAMVRKNIRAYAFLSVTIVISFATLLFFLVYSDSAIFNEYKEELQASPYISIVSTGLEEEQEKKIFQLLSKKLEDMDDTYYYTYYTQGVKIGQMPEEHLISGVLHVVPSYCWGYYYDSTTRLVLNENEKKINLLPGQAIISKELYQLLKAAQKEEDKLYIHFPISYADQSVQTYSFEVVGVCTSSLSPAIIQDEKGIIQGQVDIFVSVDNFSEQDILKQDNYMLIYSKETEIINRWLDELDLSNNTSYKAKTYADEAMRGGIFIKAIISIFLLFLLGINLYSSFSNAMNERKFEIGVRRAIGASAKDIIIQFFVEGLTVMLVNMLISVACSITLLSIYRIIRFLLYKEEWLIYITGYSISIFLCCCIFLSLMYSVLFAVMSLQVEVVHYLKND